jgi:hypothetical protein
LLSAAYETTEAAADPAAVKTVWVATGSEIRVKRTGNKAENKEGNGKNDYDLPFPFWYLLF